MFYYYKGHIRARLRGKSAGEPEVRGFRCASNSIWLFLRRSFLFRRPWGGWHTPMQPQGAGACSLSRRVAFADVQPLRLLIHNENARGSPETVLPSIRGSRGWGETAVRDHSRVGSDAFPDAAPPLRQRQKQPCSKAAALRRRGGTATFSFLQTGTIFATRKP